jgi:hypothetical protein
MKRVFKEVWLWWVTYPNKKKWNVLKGWHDRARRHTVQEMEAQRSVRKEIRPEGKRGLKGALERR